MQGFNPELKIGMQAMIIGVRNPDNAWAIGKLVVIEAFVEVGECLPPEFTAQGFASTHKNPEKMAIVSGVHTHYLVIENHANINIKYLMPLPPLDDDVIIEATQKPKELAKC